MFDWLFGLLIFAITFTPSPYFRGLIFVYGIIGLWCLSLIIKPKVNFRSIELGLLLLLSLAGIFLNGYTIRTDTVIVRFLNTALMYEAFIYLLAGVIFVKLFVEYVQNKKVIIYSLPFAFIPMLVNSHGRFTIPLSLGLSCIIYLLMLGREGWERAGFLIIGMLGFVIFNWHLILIKWGCRPIVWIDMLNKIKEHPFIGDGFNKSFLPANMMWVDYQSYGWLYKHNDYGAMGMALGAGAVILLFIFLLRIYRKIFNKPIAIFFLAACLCCFFQSTMFDSYHAILFLSILGLSLKEVSNASNKQEAEETYGHSGA